jgi:acetoin utilization deacetylase AcuC-like enzyme
MTGIIQTETSLVVFLPRFGYLSEVSVFKRNILCSELLQEESIAEVRSGRDAVADELKLFHTNSYVEALQTGIPQDLASSGFTWDPRLYQVVVSKAGSLLDAIDHALTWGVSGVLGGGGHHAHPGYGGALSPVNDIGIGVHYVRRHRKKILVLDLDLHFGNGTTAGFPAEQDVFLFDYHGHASEYFEPKTPHLFRNLSSQPTGDNYLKLLREELPQVLDDFYPEFCLYLAGMDVFGGTPNAHLRLSVEGIIERENYVFSELAQRGIPTVYAHGGGYASEETVVRLHSITARAAAKVISLS